MKPVPTNPNNLQNKGQNQTLNVTNIKIQRIKTRKHNQLSL